MIRRILVDTGSEFTWIDSDVLQKIGMRREGTMRQHLVKWNERVDVDCYGIIREDWMKKSI